MRQISAITERAMADEQRPSPFARTLPPPTEGGPSPFARPPIPRPAAAAFAPAPARTTPPTPAARPVAAGGENLPMGFLAGLVAATVGAGLWAGITLLTYYQIGWMAVGVGALVGVAVRRAGRGTTKVFGYLGAALALGGCLVGNLLTGSVILAGEWGMSLPIFFTRLTPDLAMDLMKAMFSPMDLLFYGLAIWQGYKLSIVGGSDS
jgi:hypothetical protein